MTHPFKFPQPTPAELAEPKNIWLSVNRFWWELLQGRLEVLAESNRWDDYTEDIAQAVHEMMTGDQPPMSVFLGAKVYRTNNLSLAISANVPVQFENLSFDTGGFWDEGQPTRLTAPYDAYFMVCGSVSFAANATGRRRVRVLHNNITVIGDSNLPGTSAGNTVFGFAVPFFLAASDWVEITAFQDAVNPLNLVGTISQTWLSLINMGFPPPT